MKKITFIVAAFLAVSLISFAQSNQSIDNLPTDAADYPYWIEMMQDPEANFYTTVAAFEKYWEGREIEKSSGYKPFKRWENHWRDRIYADGTRRPANEAFNSYFQFRETMGQRDNEFTGDWENLGPIEKPGNAGTGQPNGNGRINAIAFHPTDADILYIGAPAGGLWVTEDGGETWTSNTDSLPTLGVSSILIDYSNTDIIYIGTGDRDAGDAVGLGIMKSTDGGLTFDLSNTGMGDVTVGRMIMHPSDPDIILAATSSGIYKTTSGGTFWSNEINGNFKEIVFKADDPNIVFASQGGSFYRSVNTGDSWTLITSGIGSASRGVIGVTEANADVVYFHTVSGSEYAATYQSTDAGLNFTEKATSPNIMSWGCNGGSGGQGWYDLDVAVDPNNENLLYSGGVNAWRSANGASSWSINSHWVGDCGVPAVHADCHVLEFSPVDGRLYAGNDGGIYWTDNNGANWTEITSGLAISQIYKIGQAATNKDKVMNGYQDNGSATYLGEDEGFLTVMGGDGMDCAYDHQDHRYAYGEYYNGAGISRIFNNSNQGGIGGGIGESGAWVTPFALDVTDPETMYVGMKNIWVSHNIRSYNVQWTNISNFNTQNCRVVEQSEADAEIFYVAKWGDGLLRSDDISSASPQWTNLTGSLPIAGTPTDIETSPLYPDVVYMTLNYKVWKSEDRGFSWEDISLNLPVASTNTIEVYKNSDEGLYLGTDAGVFYKDNTMDEWLLFADGFPVSANVTEIEFYYDSLSPADDAIRVSTYGRGLWTSPTFYSTPIADFESNESNIPSGCAIDFIDKSTGIPHQWAWSFEGATPDTSNEQNPVNIQYLNQGTFAVSLTVSNPAGADTKTITEYIIVSDAMLPIVNFMAEDTVQCTGGITQFIDQSEGCPIQWLWSFSPDNIVYIDGTDETSENPLIQFNESGAYSVSLTVTNSAGESSITKENYIFAGGQLLPFSERFQGDSYAAMGWSVNNPDGNTTWELTTLNGTDQLSWMNFFDYTNFEARDYLTSPLMNFSGLETVLMYFEYAYAQRYNQKDSLIVNISSDCGESWTRVYANGPDGEGIFATSEPSDNFFEPTSTADWCGSGYGADCPIIDLSNWAGQANIKIQFEAFNKFGNNLYLNNVEVGSTVGLFDKNANGDGFSIFPNPASTSITITGNENAQIDLFDLQGKNVLSVIPKSIQTTLDIQSLQKGIYFVRITGESATKTVKLIIQ
ncbi:MAG: hypothetical protein DRI89_07400 [Bacteroidetes bacterium]|nr:MAG: hypothetical protein DRI89_07400 [Bacteroidota bacterium]